MKYQVLRNYLRYGVLLSCLCIIAIAIISYNYTLFLIITEIVAVAALCSTLLLLYDVSHSHERKHILIFILIYIAIAAIGLSLHFRKVDKPIYLIIFAIKLILIHHIYRGVAKKNFSRQMIKYADTYYSLFKNIQDGVAHLKLVLDNNYNPTDLILYDANDAFAQLVESRCSDIVGKSLFQIISKEIQTKIGQYVLSSKEGERIDEEMVITTIDGTEKIFSVNVYLTDHKKDNNNMELIAIINDITEKKRKDDAIRYLAFHDSLTGIYNRTYFDEQMDRYNRDMARFYPLSIMCIDVDGLKFINDALGHKEGDETLKRITNIICKAFRKSDIIARTGGDEFCAILTNTPNDVALARKQKLLDLVEEYNNSSNSIIEVSISIGIATACAGEYKNIYDVLKHADNDMYSYKLDYIEKSTEKILKILESVLAEKDYVLAGHTDRLIHMTRIMVNELELSENTRDKLILLARVHDLGKIMIPDELLFKKETLTEEEFVILRKHSQIGYNIASRSREISYISNLILHHHERWDGTGYPSGLKGYDIPIECRLFSILDAYDVMTGRKHYMDRKTKMEAIEEIKRCSGTQFDPELAAKFIEVALKTDGI